jgi:hypothetical protein
MKSRKMKNAKDERLKNMTKCEKLKCSNEIKLEKKLDIINGKKLATMKCNLDPTQNYKFEAYNQARWPYDFNIVHNLKNPLLNFTIKYPTSPCLETQRHLMNDPGQKKMQCLRKRCKKERQAYFNNKAIT